MPLELSTNVYLISAVVVSLLLTCHSVGDNCDIACYIYMGRFRITQDFLAVNVTKIPDFAGL